jgi:DUF4097 and DUF4098 domain-containing protein YvlB
MVSQMNIRRKGFYLLGAALLLTGCVAGERHAVTVRREWQAAEIERLEVKGVNGDLRVEAADTDRITLVADVKARGISPSKRENHGYFETEVDGDTLRIVQQRKRVHARFPFIGGKKLEIDYALKVPERLALELTTVNGRIATRGMSGGAELKSVNGAIDAEVKGAKDFEAQTVNGRIRATFQDDFRGARIKTVNGGVQAILPVSASFTCDLSQVNGDFEASFPLSIHSHPGRRRVSGEVNGGRYKLRISTVNGNVRVQHPDSPSAPAAPPEIQETPEMPEIPPTAPVPPPPVS